jgi:opacity protein-like surface antigen
MEYGIMKLSAWMSVLTLALTLSGLFCSPVKAAEEGKPKVYTIEMEIDLREFEEEEEDEYEFPYEFDFVGSVRIGVDHAAVGENQQVRISTVDTAPNDFILTNPWQTKMVWGGFLGVEFPLFDSRVYSWQTGAAYYNTNPFHVQGIVTAVGDPAAAELNFEYTVRNQRAMWENKLFAKLNDRFSIYFLGGIGAAFNKASDFEETVRDPRDDVDAYFENNTKTSFSYSAGLGLEIVLWENLRSSLGYQFSDLGKIELGDLDTSDSTNETLTSPNTQTHEFIFGLSYVY